MQEKLCPVCHVVKLITSFSRDRSRRDGHNNRCKSCDAGRNRAAYVHVIGPLSGRVFGYRSMHARVARLRGRASGHMCAAVCGRRARHWAYDHTDPGAIPGGRDHGPYSLDEKHYIPLCVSCHNKIDRNPLFRPLCRWCGRPHQRNYLCAPARAVLDSLDPAVMPHREVM